MAESTKFQTRLQSPDSDMVEEYAEDNDVSESEAVRRLIKKGLQDEGYVELATSSEDRGLKERTSDRLFTWADYSMYTGVAFGVLVIATGLPVVLDLVEPSLISATVFMLGASAMFMFVLFGGVLSLLSMIMLIWAGYSWDSALPWRTKA